MTNVESLASYFRLSYNVIKRQTDGLTNEESLLQPPFRGNCLNWVVGHILHSRNLILHELGLTSTPRWTEAETLTYKRDSAPITEAGQGLPLTGLLSDLDISQELILEALKHISAQTLEAKDADGDTLGERIAFQHWHETYHVGQLELLRQLAGKNDKVI